jgi:hypothetical protein
VAHAVTLEVDSPTAGRFQAIYFDGEGRLRFLLNVGLGAAF